MGSALAQQLLSGCIHVPRRQPGTRRLLLNVEVAPGRAGPSQCPQTARSRGSLHPGSTPQSRTQAQRGTSSLTASN